MVNLKLKKIDYMERAVVDVGTVDTKSVTLPKRWLGILGLTDVKRVKVPAKELSPLLLEGVNPLGLSPGRLDIISIGKASIEITSLGRWLSLHSNPLAFTVPPREFYLF